MKKYGAKVLHPDASELNHQAYKSGCALFRDGSYSKAKVAFEHNTVLKGRRAKRTRH